MALNTNEENALYVADKIFDICNQKRLRTFDGFFPVVTELFEDDENYVLFQDVTPDCLSGPVNGSCFVFGKREGTNAQKQSQFFRFRSISRKELRKRTGCFAMDPYCLEVGFEKYKHNTDAFFTLKDGAFVPIPIPNYEYVPIQKEIDQAIRTCMACQFNLENQPHVYLRPENAAVGFTLPLDNLSQVKELFSLRDIPEGLKRRAALRHWVAKHMRRKPTNPHELVEVKKHLRGRERFSWFGIEGEIFP